ncbi:C2 NT-type domain-containing protein, partial [Haematococcus lacustris]
RKLQNAAQKARGRQALQYQFEVIPYFVATIYKDADGMQKKEYTFKALSREQYVRDLLQVQSVVKGSKGEDERKTLGKVKVDLAAFCTGELDPTPQDVFLQCSYTSTLALYLEPSLQSNTLTVDY